MGNAVFGNWYEQASEEEAKVLSILANEDMAVSLRKVQDVATSGKIKVASKNISKYLQRLLEKGLVIKTGRGLYSIQDIMFRTYLRTQK